MLGDEVLHQPVTLLRVDVDHLDAVRTQEVLRAHERPVLAEHDAGDLVEQDRARAHVTRRQRRVHRRAPVHRRGQPAGDLQGIGQSLPMLKRL